jgi:hypothetical protein
MNPFECAPKNTLEDYDFTPNDYESEGICRGKSEAQVDTIIAIRVDISLTGISVDSLEVWG